MSRNIAVIFARGGSKGLPGKNLRLLGGRPLIAHAIAVARSCPSIDRVAVSTDDPEIARVAREAGAEVPFMRPPELATDEAPEWLSWRHAVSTLRTLGWAFDRMVVLPATSPLRTVDDVERCIAAATADIDVVLTVTESARNPHFNMVTVDEGGMARLVLGDGDVIRRQDAPAMFDITTVAYVVQPDFVLRSPAMLAGRTAAVRIPPERAIDIDTALDLQIAEALAGKIPALAAAAGTATVSERMRLDGRVALITGGAGHIGRAIAEHLATLGCAVAIADRPGDGMVRAVEDLAADSNVQVVALPVDLEVEAEARGLVARVKASLGGLDILVNCAAFHGDSALSGWAVPFAQQTTDAWRRALEVNLTAVFALTQAAAPLLARSGRGSVINISSIYGLVAPDFRLYDGTGMGNPAAYAVTKAGVIQMTRWLAAAMAPDVRVNAVSPGGVARGQAESFVERYVAGTLLNRMAEERDVADACAYLAGDLAAYVTGQNLVVDGGWTVR